MDFLEKLKEQTPSWLSAEGPYPETILSTRIRVARNLEAYTFPTVAGEDELSRVWELVHDILPGVMGDLTFFENLTLSDLERHFLVERKLASPDLIRRTLPGVGGAFTPDERVSVLVNEEDHLRIQVFRPAFALDEAFQEALDLDRKIGDRVEYAFLGDFGFLTTSLTNTGLGLRISVLAHLPGIVLSKKIPEFVNIVQKGGLSVRGLYGEWSQARGNLFQISSAETLNRSEEELLERFRLGMSRILKLEKRAREELLNDYRLAVEDKIYRALGVLKHARSISFDEAAIHLSFLRLGVGLGLLMDLPLSALNEMLLFSQPAHLQMVLGPTESVEERDARRATYLRGKLSAYSL